MQNSRNHLPTRKVFLSSALRGLERYREAAKKALTKFGQVYDDFTEWTAEAEAPLQASLRHVRSADLFIMILAHRYGDPLGEAGGMSITHAELEEAVDSGVPVRAFLVDSAFPWKVSDIDKDRAKLEKLKSRVKSICTPAYFGSPESLEIEMSRCFLEILIAEGLTPQPEMARLVDAKDLRTIGADRPGYYTLGKSTDGLPLLLQIDIASKKLEEFNEEIERVVNYCQPERRAMILKEMLHGASRIATLESKHHWEICESSHGDDCQFLVLGATATRLLLRSFLSAACGTSEDDTKSSRIISSPHTTIVRMQEDGRMVAIPDAALAIGVHCLGQISIMAKAEGEEWRKKRDYVFESSSMIPELKYGIRLSVSKAKWSIDLVKKQCQFLIEQGAVIHTLDQTIEQLDTSRSNKLIGAAAEYERGVHAVFATAADYHSSRRIFALYEGNHHHAGEYLQVPLRSLVQIVLNAALTMVENERSNVHANIKPGNILVSENGIVVADGFNVTPGESAPIFSNAWAAPEQAMGFPLDSSADVYGLCKVLVAALNLQEAGEVITYQAPHWGTGGQTTNFQFIKEPYIHYHRNSSVAKFASRLELVNVLSKGLRGYSKDRIGSISELVEEIERIDFTGLSGSRLLALSPELHPNQVRLDSGEYSPCRTLSETVHLGPTFGRKPESRINPRHTIILS